MKHWDARHGVQLMALPAQLGNDRIGLSWCVGEQALESGTKKHAFRHQLSCMDALGDKKRAGPDCAGAGDVGPRRIADRENPRAIDRTSTAALGLRKRELID